MNIMMELRQRRAGLLDQAAALNTAAETEDRDFTPEETAQYDGLLAQAEQLRGRIERLETFDGAHGDLVNQPNGAGSERRVAPVQLRIGRGDNEVRALAHYFRTGDRGAVSHLMQPDERGRSSMTIMVPTQRELRAVVDSTMNITTAADGANLVPTGFSGQVATRKNESMLAERLGCRRIPGQGTTVNYPYENADPEEFGATDEQSDAHDNPYERDAGAVGLKAFTLAKKTRKVELTEEILEDNDVNMLDYIGDRIGRQIAGTHNTMLLTEVAANGTALKTFASATAIAAGEPEDIVFNDTLAYYLDSETDIAWVMRPTTFGNIASITGNSRLYGEQQAGSMLPRIMRELMGYPVYYSNKAAATAASAKDVYFGNWDFVGYREAPELRFIQDPYSVDGLVVLKYSFRAVYGVLQAGAVGYGVHPSA